MKRLKALEAKGAQGGVGGLDPSVGSMGVYRPEPGMEFTFPISA